MQSLRGFHGVFRRSVAFCQTSKQILAPSRKFHKGFLQLSSEPGQLPQTESNPAATEALPLDDADTFGMLTQKLERSRSKKIRRDPGINAKVGSENSQIAGEDQTDPDVFGELVSDAPARRFYSDTDLPEDDDKQDVYVWDYERRHVKEYTKDIIQLSRERKLQEALKQFQQMKADGIKPPEHLMPILISACGRAGYTKMAFKLFREMRDRAYRLPVCVYTSLFNACAESPFPEEGLRRARRLKEIMAEKFVQPNQIISHAMIKAFGRCGDLQAAFQLADEMKEQKIPVTEQTYQFLLMACISDKEAGFSHAIQVMWKMLAHRVRPSKYSFNLLLRAARDCGVGPPEIVDQLFGKWRQHFTRRDKPALLADSRRRLPTSRTDSGRTATDSGLNDVRLENETHESLSSLVHTSEQLPKLSLLLAPPTASSAEVLDLGTVATADSRLGLLGGMDGVLNMMSQVQASADIKTFTVMLETIPFTAADEEALLRAMDQWNVRPDADFLNLLVKKRSYRHDWTAAKATLALFQHYKQYPDIVTFGVLALGCSTMNRGLRLLQDMQGAGFRPNLEILGALVRQACRIPDYWYVMKLMKVMKELDVRPDLTALQHLEEAIERTDRFLLKKQRGEEVPAIYAEESLRQGYRAFRLQYNQWLLKTPVYKDPHPWEQYQ